MIDGKKIIYKLPWLKMLLKYLAGLVPARYHYGLVYRRTFDFLQKSQFWSREKLLAYQWQKLEILLKHARQNVPYYGRIFADYGLTPSKIQDFNDFRKIPFLSKNDLQKNLPDLLARNYPKRNLMYITTGGSTGVPVGFYQTRQFFHDREWAYVHALWSRAGYWPGSRCVILRGDFIPDARGRKLWAYDPARKRLLLSSYHLTEANMPQYLDILADFNPDFIQAYPSAITQLAGFLGKRPASRLKKLKAVLCASENLYQWQRDLIEKCFQCRVFSFYGLSERVALAGECEKNTAYHISPEYGIFEIINERGVPAEPGKELGEIIATSLDNLACPLIRYRTTDVAVPSAERCCCGRNYPLLESIEGRLQELLVTGTGRLISMTAINMHSDVFDNVAQFQFYQKKKGEAVFKIVKKNTYNDEDTGRIYSELVKKIGPDVNLSLEFVKTIPVTQSGKRRFMIQEMSLEAKNNNG